MIRPHYVPLYQSICTSEKFADLAEPSRVFYLLLLTHADSWGRCTGAARVLTAKVWPMLGKGVDDTERALGDLERVGLITRYEVGGEKVLIIPDWEEKAGKVGRPDRRGESSYPPPPDYSRKHDEACGSTPAPLPKPAGVVPPRARAQSEPSLSEPSRAEPSREFAGGAAPAPARAAASGPHAEVMAWWCKRFEEATGKPYAVEGAKDGETVKRLLGWAGAAGMVEIRGRAETFFADPWHREHGLTLTKFRSAWNSLLTAKPPPPPQPRLYTDAEEIRAKREAARQRQAAERAAEQKAREA